MHVSILLTRVQQCLALESLLVHVLTQVECMHASKGDTACKQGGLCGPLYIVDPFLKVRVANSLKVTAQFRSRAAPMTRLQPIC